MAKYFTNNIKYTNKWLLFTMVAMPVVAWTGLGADAALRPIYQQNTFLGVAPDPVAFLQEHTAMPAAHGTSMTREDAIAHEIFINSPTLNAEQAAATAREICAESNAQGYDPLLFLAVIQIESAYNHLAISNRGAQGLMQLLPSTGKGMKSDAHSPVDYDGFNPQNNVRLGVRYLSELNRSFHHVDYALTAYNRGPAATRAILQAHHTLPTHIRDAYATKVLKRYNKFLQSYALLPLH